MCLRDAALSDVVARGRVTRTPQGGQIENIQAAYRGPERIGVSVSLVKALAELLTGKGKGNAYQGVFSELYRRFGVSSYHHIWQDQYKAVLRFLSEWGEAATREEQ